ncbi:uncharacterized protein LOC130691331 isoform X2 [Daphnia carinata]|uniref:uncharacterized protein LOC130691331 isoform X2 n=1 Tax=Daphnia carinata TaxID=120202 RepID=UPI00257ED6A9|nr:uncharacterized protein LOC130691331 isoform X2 [Daphnia carinata]
MSSTTAVNVGGIQFDRNDLLGRGGYGSVYRGKYKGKSIAVKRIMKEKDGRDPIAGNELKFLQQLRHPNIVKLVHFTSDVDFTYLALELCGASLDQVFLSEDDLRKYKGPALPNDFEVFSQLATGLRYIHSQRVIHRDINPTNILISVKHTDQGEEATIKWADFVFAREVSERGTFTMSGVKGTLPWFSPEEMEIMGRDLRIEKTKGSIKSDVFKEGLVFGYILLNGRHIYGENEYDIVVNMKQNNRVNMSEIHQKHLARNLIEKMLTYTPDTRITSEEVVDQLQSIKTKLIEGEKHLHQLCADNCPTHIRDSIKILMQIGVDINAENIFGWNALHILCRYHSSSHFVDAIKLLIELSIDKNAKTNDGSNALHILCRYNSSSHLIDAIKLLIELGIDKAAKNNDGKNALHLLYECHSSPQSFQAIELLIELGVDLNAEDINGSTIPVNVDGIQFARNDFLGSGTYGHVYRGTYKGQSIAVKRILRSGAQNHDNELKILKQLDHPNIVKLVHFTSNADFDYFALELCDASLDQVFLNGKDNPKYKGPALPNNFEVFYQLATGLKYIHSKKLIHRDIKPENILISVKHTDQGEELMIKWADFGLSREVSERGTFTMSGVKGTKIWFSPEVMEIMGRDLQIEKAKGSIKSDVYAEGLVFGYILLKGKHIYGENALEIAKNITKSVNMSGIHQKHLARTLIEQMLTSTPEKRITSEEVVNQLGDIKNKLTEEEKNLHRLCADQCRTTDYSILPQWMFDTFVYRSDIRDKIESLIQLGIDINAKDKDGWNALHFLCRNNSSPHLIVAIKLLIELGIDKNAKTNDGSNALHILCEYNSSQHLIDAIKLLIELEIDKAAKNNDGKNALQLLCRHNSSPQSFQAIELLIKLGVDLR